MPANPILGVLLHWLGGFASASFYLGYRGVKKWAWETYWLAGGFFSWIIMPWFLAFTMTRDLTDVLRETPASTLAWSYTFGVLWGLGGLTFGLTMRYLGLSLGMAVALGYTAAFGTLLPPIFRGVFGAEVLGTRSGQVILAGVLICLCGIVFAGAAGMTKERELSQEQKMETVREFNLKRGLLMATFSGIMSACFAYGLAAGDPIKEIAVRHGTPVLWQGLPVLVVVLAGGFTTNFIWCAILNVRNRTAHQYFAPVSRGEAVPMLANYFFCAVAGTLWYLQFFFYSMGETQMGRFRFSSWTLHMASIIIFSTLWGLALREWKGVGRRTTVFVTLSLAVLILSTVVVGYGNYLGSAGTR